MRWLSLLKWHQQHHGQEYYYNLRRQHHLNTPVERAARLIYLNKTCYNGLYREKIPRGSSMSPWGSTKTPRFVTLPCSKTASAILQRADIAELPFEMILDWPLSRQDFVYFDPPYHPISITSSFTRYNRYGFTASDQERLAHVFRELAQRGIPVMLSNSDCDLVRKLYTGFPIHPIQAARAINSKAGRRGKIQELLITSY